MACKRFKAGGEVSIPLKSDALGMVSSNNGAFMAFAFLIFWPHPSGIPPFTTINDLSTIANVAKWIGFSSFAHVIKFTITIETSPAVLRITRTLASTRVCVQSSTVATCQIAPTTKLAVVTYLPALGVSQTAVPEFNRLLDRLGVFEVIDTQVADEFVEGLERGADDGTS